MRLGFAPARMLFDVAVLAGASCILAAISARRG